MTKMLDDPSPTEDKPNLVSLSGCPFTQQRAFRIADENTRRHASNRHWSSWHTWNCLCQNPNSTSAFWSETYPFATCVGFYTSIAAELSFAYGTTKGVEHLAGSVQLYASWGEDPNHVESKKRPRHCIVALLADDECMLIDLVYSPTVIVVTKGGEYGTVPYSTISGRRGRRVFHYDGDGLSMSNPKRDNASRDEFILTSPTEALHSISAISNTKTVPDSVIPVNKLAIIRMIVDEPPSRAPGFDLGAGARMITAFRLQVDFEHRRLTMQIPLEDWLLQSRNQHHQWIQIHETFRELDAAVVNLIEDLSPHHQDDKTKEGLKMLANIGGCVILPAGELERIVDSVYEVWAGRWLCSLTR